MIDICKVFALSDRYLLEPVDRSSQGWLYACRAPAIFPAPLSDRELGQAVHACLEDAGQTAPEPPYRFEGVESAQHKRLLEAAELKRWKDFVPDARVVSITRGEGRYTLSPLQYIRKSFDFIEGAKVTLMSDDFERLGGALREVFARCLAPAPPKRRKPKAGDDVLPAG